MDSEWTCLLIHPVHFSSCDLLWTLWAILLSLFILLSMNFICVLLYGNEFVRHVHFFKDSNAYFLKGWKMNFSYNFCRSTKPNYIILYFFIIYMIRFCLKSIIPIHCVFSCWWLSTNILHLWGIFISLRCM